MNGAGAWREVYQTGDAGGWRGTSIASPCALIEGIGKSSQQVSL